MDFELETIETIEIKQAEWRFTPPTSTYWGLFQLAWSLNLKYTNWQYLLWTVNLVLFTPVAAVLTLVWLLLIGLGFMIKKLIIFIYNLSYEIILAVVKATLKPYSVFLVVLAVIAALLFAGWYLKEFEVIQKLFLQ